MRVRRESGQTASFQSISWTVSLRRYLEWAADVVASAVGGADARKAVVAGSCSSVRNHETQDAQQTNWNARTLQHSDASEIVHPPEPLHTDKKSRCIYMSHAWIFCEGEVDTKTGKVDTRTVDGRSERCSPTLEASVRLHATCRTLRLLPLTVMYNQVPGTYFAACGFPSRPTRQVRSLECMRNRQERETAKVGAARRREVVGTSQIRNLPTYIVSQVKKYSSRNSNRTKPYRANRRHTVSSRSDDIFRTEVYKTRGSSKHFICNSL